MKPLIVIFLTFSILLCSSCSKSHSSDTSSDVDSSSGVNSVSSSSYQQQVDVVPLMPCFRTYFVYETFADINKDITEKGTDAFYYVLPKNLGGMIPLTENNSAERKKELAVAFSGYTYIPKYGDDTAIFVDSITMEIPASACFDEFYTLDYHSQFDMATEFTYIVRIETPDGDGSNYACVKVCHKTDSGKQHREYWFNDKSEVREFLVDGKKVEGIVDDLEIRLVVDDDTYIIMSFNLDLKNPYEIRLPTDRQLRELSMELYSGEWLSKISFEKINLWNSDDCENLKHESEVIIPYEQ